MRTLGRRDRAHLVRTDQQRCEIVIRQRPFLVGEAIFETGFMFAISNRLPSHSIVCAQALSQHRRATSDAASALFMS